uniref:Uncharacterized protein n=1 Tax=Salix viminalis TaxID=40686 RepID=A0A6N2LKA4_SALVM
MFYLSISVIPLWSGSRMASGAAILFNKCVASGSDGLKTIEGSCAVGDNNRMASGAAILFNNRIFIHASFLETMEAEGFEKVLPEVNTIAEEFTESDRQKRRKDPMESLLRVLQNQLPSPTFLTQNPPCESSRFLACKVLYA